LRKGLFITFEGIDRSGKSTQIERLEARLKGEGHRVVAMRDPGGTEVSEQIRTILLSIHNTIDPVAELLLYEAARAQLVAEKIRPALENNMTVLVDRFYDSTTAYQGYGRGIPLGYIEQANEIATGGLKPDLTFFIDITWEEASRRNRLAAADRMESEDHLFFGRIRNGYIQIVQENSKRVKLIDGSQSVEAIERKIFEETQHRLRQFLINP
jgi:dTMP kinase